MPGTKQLVTTRIRTRVFVGFIWVLVALSYAQAGVFQDIKDYVTDSKAGKFVSPTERAKRDRERILNVLSYEGAIYYDESGRPHVKDQRKLDTYYKTLQQNGVLEDIPGFRKEDDRDQRQSGQFWRNFLDGKDYTRGDTPATLDPFENLGRGLATRIHTELSTATSVDSISYAETATTLKVRGIDILERDLREGVAAGAETMIKAMDAMTGGTSTKAAEWMEEMAPKLKAFTDDPVGKTLGYARDKVEAEVKDYVLGKIESYKKEALEKADEALKKALGESQYEKLMKGYEKYEKGEKRLEKILDDLAKTTGDPRLKEIAEELKEFAPDAIADKLSKEIIAKAKEALLPEDKEEEAAEEQPEEDLEEQAEEQPEDKKSEEPDDAGKAEKPEPTEKADKDSAPAGPEATAGDEPHESVETEAGESDASTDDASGGTTVTKGYVEGPDGTKITVTEVQGPDGRVISVTETTTDAEGKIISQTVYAGGTGEGKTTTPSSDLRSAEAEAGADVDIGMAAKGLKTADGFSSQWKGDQDRRSSASAATMAQQAQMTESANIANQELRDAKTTRNVAGRDARMAQDDGVRDANKAARQQSWGKAIGDAVATGITEGGKAFGEAIGQAAGDHVASSIFSGGTRSTGSTSDEEDASTAGTDTCTDCKDDDVKPPAPKSKEPEPVLILEGWSS